MNDQPSQQRYDVIVIGVGSMGAAACFHLARRGLNVLGLERHTLVHEFGSHHGRARMIRQAYFEHPDYVPLLRRAYENWDELESQCGQRSLHRTGGLYIGKPDGAIVGGSLAAAREHGLPYEMLDHAALGERFPAFRVPDHMVGFLEPEAGFLVPEIAVATHAGEARRHGAELREGEAVRGWTVTSRGDAAPEVVVDTDAGSYRAGHLVLTAGAWTSSLLEELSIELRVTRQVQAWFRPRSENTEALRDNPLPCWFVETNPPYGHYGFPLGAGDRDGDRARAVKVAIHKPASTTDPDRVDRRVNRSEIDALETFLATHLPCAAGEAIDSAVCLYTNSADGHFIVDRHPEHAQVTLACGFSGHGFKFASVIGEALADLAEHGRSDLAIEFLGLDRLR